MTNEIDGEYDVCRYTRYAQQGRWHVLGSTLVYQVHHRTRWVGTAGKCRYPYPYLLDLGEILLREGPKGLQINGHTAELARKG